MIIDGTVAVVVGGARGVGKDYARQLLEKKAKVNISYGNTLSNELCLKLKHAYII